jgi:pimeloyl-ACP methyl ester carboxylesterase
MGGMGTDFTNPEWPRRIMFYHAFMGEDIAEAKAAVDYARSQNLDLLALAYLQRSQPSTPKEVLQKIKQPVLVICGSEDSDNGSARDLAKLFSNSTFATTPGDHNHASGTKEFSDAVIKFLSANYK